MGPTNRIHFVYTWKNVWLKYALAQRQTCSNMIDSLPLPSSLKRIQINLSEDDETLLCFLYSFRHCTS